MGLSQLSTPWEQRHRLFFLLNYLFKDVCKMNNLDRDSVSPWVKEQACLLSAIIKILSLSGAKGRHAYYPF